MHTVLSDAIHQSGVQHDPKLASELLSGFGVVKDLIESTSPQQWSGRTRNSTKDHINEFLARDPIYTALHTSLFAADEGNGTHRADQFEQDSRDVLARADKLVSRHEIDPQQRTNVERAYLCILYMNTLEGIANPVRDTFVGMNAETYTQLLTEINRLEVDKIGELRAYEVLIEYAEQVASLDNPAPKGAAWLRQVWEILGPQPASGDTRDFRGDLGELREDLCSIVGTLDEVERYCSGAPFSIAEENSLASSLLHLNEKAGLRHLPLSEVKEHLLGEGIGNRMALTHLFNIALVLERGVAVPAELRQDEYGRKIVSLAASGSFFVPKMQEPEALQIAARFHLERAMIGDQQFTDAYARLGGPTPLVPGNHLSKVQIYNFYHVVREQGCDLPTEEIVESACRLRNAGLLNGQSTLILQRGHSTEYPLQGFAFLRNMVQLAEHKVTGVAELHRAFTHRTDEQIGAMAEAAVAVNLIRNGHEVHALRKIGPKSGHIDYDVVATIDGRKYGIEVKSTVEALQQKNFHRDGRVEHTQLLRLTQHAAIDGLHPAVICWDLRGASLVRSSLRDMWNEVARVTRATGVPVPALFDRSGKQFQI